MPEERDRREKVSRWYFGGTASCMSVICTHPLDLVKVHLQTQQEGKLTFFGAFGDVIKRRGVLGLFDGLSAAILRQMTYAMTRFGIYEVLKQNMPPDVGVLYKIGSATIAGALGGFVGTPGDLINVRMQNDSKLPADKRRNYKHAIDGVIRVWREEGFTTLFNGASMATGRAILMTVGQLVVYDQVKDFLLKTDKFEDNLATHMTSSISAGIIATTLTQPVDVLKTRAMNAKPGEFKGTMDLIMYTARLGPLGFFKGYVPAFIRIGPVTVLLFVFMEQLRLNFGYFPEPKKK